MPIYALGDRVPAIHPDAFVHPDAVVIGDVRIGADSSIWPRAVLRGDYGTIIVGERTSIQDGAVVHAVASIPTVIGDDCVIGHLAHLEGCVIHDRALVGSGSIVLHRSRSALRRHRGRGGRRAQSDGGSDQCARRSACRRSIKLDSCDEAVAVASAALYAANARRYREELRRL